MKSYQKYRILYLILGNEHFNNLYHCLYFNFYILIDYTQNPNYIIQTIDGLLYVSSINKVNSIQEKLAWTLNCVSEILVDNWLVVQSMYRYNYLTLTSNYILLYFVIFNFINNSLYIINTELIAKIVNR